MFFPEFFQGRSVRAFGKKNSQLGDPGFGCYAPPKTMEGTIIWKMYLLPRESSKYSKYARAGRFHDSTPRPPPSMPVTSRRLLISFIFTGHWGIQRKTFTLPEWEEHPTFQQYNFLEKRQIKKSKTTPYFWRKYPVPLLPKPFQSYIDKILAYCNRQIPQEVQPLLKDGSLKNLRTGHYRPPTSHQYPRMTKE